MSLLNFLFRDKQKDVNGRQAKSPPVTIAKAPAKQETEAPTTQQTADETSADTGAEQKQVASNVEAYNESEVTTEDLNTILKPSMSEKPTLDQIRAALSKISEVIDDDDEQPLEDTSSGNFTTLDLQLSQIASIIPNVFPPEKVPAGQEDMMAGVLVEHLFEQLSKGKVTTTVGRMINKINEDHLVPEYERYRNDEVSIPLNLAVTCVRPDELAKRTSSEEREPELSSMPNLFSRPGAPQVSAPILPEPPAQPKPPPVEKRPEPEPPAPVHDETIFGRPIRTDSSPIAPAGRLPFYSDEVEDEKSQEPEEPARSNKGFTFEFGDDVPVFKMNEPDGTANKSVESEPVSLEPVSEEPVAVDPEEQEAATAEPEFEEPVAVDPEEQEAATAEPEFEETTLGGSYTEEPTAIEPVLGEPVAEDLEFADSVAAELEGAEPAIADFTAPGLVGVESPFSDAEQRESVEPGADQEAAACASGTISIRGVDLNQATEEELAARLDGVGQRLAARLVRFRDFQGGFRSVADISRVPGVGPTTYEKITGQSWSEARDSVRRALEYLLGTESSDTLPDMREIAERFTDLAGVVGCIFTHEEGYTLAESWDHPNREILCAVAPQIFKKMTTYADQLEMGEMNPVTLFIGDHTVSVVQSGDIYMTVVHNAGKLGKGQIKLLQIVGAELEVRFEKGKAGL